MVEAVLRSRLARVLLAGALIALSIWAFLPHIAYRVAPTAFVNAELLRITAPMAGRLADDLPRKGDFIEQTRTLKLTETLAPDRRHLLDLEQQRAVAKDRAELAKRQLDEIGTFDRELETRIEAYRAGMIERLGQQIAEAEAEKTGCLAEFQQRQDIGTRMGQLAKSGHTSQIRSAEAAALQEANAARCEMAEARVRRLKVERDSVQGRVYLHDGASDVPYSQQQRDRLMLRRQELETEFLQQSSRVVQLATEIAGERDRLNRLGHSDVVLPAGHVVWSVSASPGSTVTEGQVILDLADCTHRFVAVDLREREFERFKSGASVTVRLVGSEGWRQGTVRQVLGSAARTDNRLLAAQIPRPTSNSIVMEVELLGDKSEVERNIFCNIGRMAEVRFERGDFGLASRASDAWAWLTRTKPLPDTVGSAGSE